MKARIANIAEPGVTTGGSADATGLFNQLLRGRDPGEQILQPGFLKQ